MRKVRLLSLLAFLGALLLALPTNAQTESREVYGWLRYDNYNQSDYGICKFTTDNAENIQSVWPYDPARVACAGAYAEGFYYVYLYETDGYNATPYSFNRINLATGESTQVADYRGMPFLFQDMTYDYSTQTMFATAYDENVYTAVLLKIDLTTGEATTVGEMGENKFMTLACSYEGQLYAIDIDYGDLWSIDKSTGAATSIGNTGERVSEDYLQTMEFDHETNLLYWAGDNFWGTVDTNTGAAQQISWLGNDAQVVGLYIPFKKTNADAPAEITDLTVTPGEQGALSAQLSWTNPATTFGGGSLTELSRLEIYRNDQLVHTIDNPIIGQKESWTDTQITEKGLQVYSLSAINSLGNSLTTAQAVFVGRDLPAAPAQPVVTRLDETSARISWQAPQSGINGGWIDASSLTYKITRQPGNQIIAGSISATEYIDNTIDSRDYYAYQIQAITPEGESPVVTTDKLVLGPALSVPYFCNFATDDQFALWSVIDANHDDYSWKRETTMDAAYYYYNEDGETGGDDWLISSPIHLEQGKSYRLRFKLQAYDSSYPEKVAVYLGTDASIEGQTVQLGDYLVEEFTLTEHKVILPQDLETGNYYISFHCYSDPYMFILYLTDVTLEEVNEGSISGIVTDGTNPLEGVTVSIQGHDLQQTTDESGAYTFKELEIGSYTLRFDKMGYRPAEQTGITVEMGETTTVNQTMELLPVYSVSGKLVNVQNRPVDQAKLSITGYADYSTQSGTDGSFSFPQVYEAEQYALSIERYGMSDTTLTINVTGGDLVLNNIVLTDKPLPPHAVSATRQGETTVIAWEEPVDTRQFRHDNGIHSGRLGTSSSTAKSVYGAVFRTPAKLMQMTWFTENYLTTHPTVNVFVFDLDAEGNPTSTLLFSQMNVPNKDMGWTTFDFPEPIDAPNGYMLAISYEGHVGLGLDNGEGPDYPFTEQTNCYAEDYTTGQFTYTEEHDIRRSLMIRGIGILLGEDELPSTTTDKRYSVWRLTDGQQETPSEWTLLTETPVEELTYTDNTWNALTQGIYRYAVTTGYNNGAIVSPAAFSQPLDKDMYTRITLNLKTNTPQNEAQSAHVVLAHVDGNADHVYTGTADKAGQVVFDQVWKGLYNVSITLKGFNDFTVQNADFSTENSYTLSDYTLQEYIVNPFNLEVVKDDQQQGYIFNWNVADYLFDDFESHTDFAINSPGSVGWSYIDGDGRETYGIDGVDFINDELPKAYIVFNPYTTDPNIALFDSNIRPHSGEKYLASFPARPGANDDYVISPELNFNRDFVLKFYAKSYTDDYGEEQMNVGYSTTGKEATDFIWLNEEGPISVPMSQWNEYRYTIPAEARYVTINCVSDNIFIFMVDDIFIGLELPDGVDLEKMKDDISFEVYLDGERVNTTPQSSYLFTGLSKGTHKAGVKAVFSSVTTPLTEIEFEVDEESGIARNQANSLTVHPNPAQDVVTVSGEYDYLSILNLSGHEVSRHTAHEVISVRELPAGVYIVRIVAGNRVETTKLIVTR
ncbi:carboxypeptidase regulatory-like domain-containing protein [Barnesiella viscericola]|uniref:carboxypeptidase regulatory-like domain-containing protein n=1 Tax=Barnesiella viscericola TaxID=397865 RepID=UPI0009FF1F1C|nr:carboxypeptidase regulatory-like domain-containing protein [Barnesiella viscericola]